MIEIIIIVLSQEITATQDHTLEILISGVTQDQNIDIEEILIVEVLMTTEAQTLEGIIILENQKDILIDEMKTMTMSHQKKRHEKLKTGHTKKKQRQKTKT